MRILIQIQWFLLLGLILFGLIGCGDDDHDDGPDLASGTEGVVVDPYIVGATFFEDANGNGLLDAEEQVSTASDASGYFTFADPVAPGSQIVMAETGLHQGLPLTVSLRRSIAAGEAGPVLVSPLTTLLAAGFTPGELLDLFSQAGMPGADSLLAEDLIADPMAGLETLTADSVTEADLALLRANFAAYGILEFLNYADFRTLERGGVEAALATNGFTETLFSAVAHLCSPETLGEANNQLPAGLPPMTMTDLAETVPAVLYWLTGQFYADRLAEREYFPTAAEMNADLDAFVNALAPYAYALNHINDPLVDPAEFLNADLLPLTEDTYFMLANQDGPAEVRPVVSEVRLTSEPFEDVTYVLMGQVMHFAADGTWQVLSGDSEGVDIVTGTWSVAGNDLTLTNAAEGSSFTLTLVGEWESYLRFATSDPVFDNQAAGVVNLMLAKLRNLSVKDLAEQSFIIDDDYCVSGFCGGWLELGNFDETTGWGEATLAYYPDSAASVSATWWLDETGAVVIETTDEVNELYFHNAQDGVVVVTRDRQGTVIDVSAEHFYQPDRPDAIQAAVYSVASNATEELILREDQFFSWSDGVDTATGLWSYDSATGELTLTVDGEVAVRLWFYHVDGPEAEEFPFFYEDYEAGLLVESGFDQLLYKAPALAPPVNLALNKPVTVETNTVSGDPDNVVDGDTGTLWYSWQGIPANCIFTVDLQAEYQIDNIYLQILQTETYQIESSLNGTDWTLRDEASGLWGTGHDEYVIFSPTFQARYLRYTGTNEENAYVGLTEFQVFGP